MIMQFSKQIRWHISMQIGDIGKLKIKVWQNSALVYMEKYVITNIKKQLQARFVTRHQQLQFE